MQDDLTAAERDAKPAVTAARSPLAPARPVEVYSPVADRPARLRIALAHDWLCGRRGGELVLERIASFVATEHTLTGVYTMFDDGKGVGASVDAARHVVWPVGAGRWGAGAGRRWLFPAYPMAVRWLSGQLAHDDASEPIDLLISTSSAAIKGLTPPPGVPHLCYCHTPARYAWGDDHSSGLRALGLRVVSPGFRRWDARTASGVTRFLANSREVERRIREAYGVGSRVVPPPVRTTFFTPDQSIAREDFWLCVGALEPYKRIELAIEAARRAHARLVVIGRGSRAATLRRLARGTRAEFFDRASDEDLRDCYRRARLVVFPQVEDFGIVAVEAQACGTPVVARRAGGALDTVEEGATGVFFDAPTPEALAEAAGRCPEPNAACRMNAERFAQEVFDAALAQEIEALAPSARPRGGSTRTR